jgi:hypothetical protein
MKRNAAVMVLKINLRITNNNDYIEPHTSTNSISVSADVKYNRHVGYMNCKCNEAGGNASV